MWTCGHLSTSCMHLGDYTLITQDNTHLHRHNRHLRNPTRREICPPLSTRPHVHVSKLVAHATTIVVPGRPIDMPTDPRHTSEWKRVRLIVLERDGYICQIRGPRCTRRATAVDHIIPLVMGGDAFDTMNLRASCLRCNCGRRVGVQRRRRRRPAFGSSSNYWG